jgi:hypothetical protein
MEATVLAAPINPNRALAVARLHGALNVLGGLWPLVHMQSFEAVLGPKVDRWLAYTVAGLLVGIGTTQLGAGNDPASLRLARRVGIGSALTLGTIDLVYASRGRISKTYLLDALGEVGLLLARASTAIRSDGR